VSVEQLVTSPNAYSMACAVGASVAGDGASVIGAVDGTSVGEEA
jgi:hypothetical protein